jgi:hypothetical protein
MYRRNLPNTITAANLLEYSKSFVGREYKILMEVAFYLFRNIFTRRADSMEDPELSVALNMPLKNSDLTIAEEEDDPCARHLRGYEYDSTDKDDEHRSDGEET